MNNISMVNLSRKIKPETAEVLRTVRDVCAGLDLPWVVVGATARDIVLQHGYGAEVKRATHDIDFAVEVADWDTFERIKQKLMERGFRESGAPQRLFSPNDETIDLVPFGQLEDEDKKITWPPDRDVEMNVLGFSEACQHAVNVILDEESDIRVPVATPVGVVLLKMIAWTDRAGDMRGKDAADIGYVLGNYEEIPSVADEAYDEANTGVMERYDWDLTLASAHLLGRHARQIATAQTSDAICALLQDKIKKRPIETLVSEMSQNPMEYERNDQMIKAFAAGFQEE